MSTVGCWFQRTLKQLEREQTDRQTDRHTHRTTTVTLAHARRGLKTHTRHTHTQKKFSEALADPEFVVTDFAKFDHPDQLHLLWQAVDRFHSTTGRLPSKPSELVPYAFQIKYPGLEVSLTPDSLIFLLRPK